MMNLEEIEQAILAIPHSSWTDSGFEEIYGLDYPMSYSSNGFEIKHVDTVHDETYMEMIIEVSKDGETKHVAATCKFDSYDNWNPLVSYHGIIRFVEQKEVTVTQWVAEKGN